MTVIEVMANPYIALAADGVPQGTVATPGYPNSHIGARLDPVATRKTGKERFYFPLGRDGKALVKVGFTSEIAQAIRSGELIAVDEKTARICGVSKFLPPDQALKREEEKAAAYLTSLQREDVTLQPIPREATPEETDDDKAVADPTKVKLTPTVTLQKRDEETFR